MKLTVEKDWREPLRCFYFSMSVCGDVTRWTGLCREGKVVSPYRRVFSKIAPTWEQFQIYTLDRWVELAQRGYVRVPHQLQPMCFFPLSLLFQWIYSFQLFPCWLSLHLGKCLPEGMDFRAWPCAKCAGEARRFGCPGAFKMLRSPCVAGAPVRISSTEAPRSQRHGPRLGSPTPSACWPLAPRCFVKDVPQQSSGPGHLWDPQPERTHPQPHEDGDRPAGRHSQGAQGCGQGTPGGEAREISLQVSKRFGRDLEGNRERKDTGMGRGENILYIYISGSRWVGSN